MNVKERFIKYVKFYTDSDENSTTYPSTARQTVLIKELEKELKELGLKTYSDQGVVTAEIPATAEGLKTLAFIAHVDTSPAVSGENVNPQCIMYHGGDIVLKNGLVISASENPELDKYVDKELIVTDGETLLGADDKAGVAEIMDAAEKIVKDKDLIHGKIMIAFTTDEEVGRGTEGLDLSVFKADFGYTIDGGELGEVEYENFNAAAAELTVNGFSIHPGSAKNKMKNAIDLFCEFHKKLPEEQRPVNTEKYQGFFMADALKGDVESLTCKYIIRDHDKTKFEEKKEFFAKVVKDLNLKYGENTFVCKITDSYYNMAEIIKKNFHLVENAVKAFENAGVKANVIPIRGGTDGALLSYKGLPCPNLSTGGMFFHGKRELIPSFTLEKMSEVIINIVKLYSVK